MRQPVEPGSSLTHAKLPPIHKGVSPEPNMLCLGGAAMKEGKTPSFCMLQHYNKEKEGRMGDVRLVICLTLISNLKSAHWVSGDSQSIDIISVYPSALADSRSFFLLILAVARSPN